MKIVFLDEYSVCGQDMSRIKSMGEYIGYETTEPHEVLERVSDAEVIITNKVVLDAQTIAQLPHLKLICVAATGMNNVDLVAAAEHGVLVRNAIGYSTDSVAEATIGSALALMREVTFYNDFFHAGYYSASKRIFNFDRPTAQIGGKRWGIIGMGNIGRRVAKLAEAFGCEVNYYSTSGITRDESYNSVSLNELLTESDIVSIHCPLNEKTLDLISEEQLSMMKRSAILINVARGGIVNEAALAEALNNGVIRGAALDVFSSEPLRESPLYHLQDRYRLLASPHNAWSSVEAIARLVECIADNIECYAKQRQAQITA